MTVTAVEYKEEEKTVKVNTREEVEEEIMKCLTKRFLLTNQCTSMSKTFITKVVYLAEKSGTKIILKGMIPNEWKENKDLDLFLGLLKYLRTREYIAETIETKDFIKYWRKAK